MGVIPTKSITQSLAAVAVHEVDIEFEQDVVNMTRAASATHYGAVTRATRDVLTMVGECRGGDYLGLIDGEISIIGQSLTNVAEGVLERLLIPGAELVTVVAGVDCTESDTQTIAEWVRIRDSVIDIEVIRGEQPLWPMIFGVE